MTNTNGNGWKQGICLGAHIFDGYLRLAVCRCIICAILNTGDRGIASFPRVDRWAVGKQRRCLRRHHDLGDCRVTSCHAVRVRLYESQLMCRHRLDSGKGIAGELFVVGGCLVIAQSH